MASKSGFDNARKTPANRGNGRRRDRTGQAPHKKPAGPSEASADVAGRGMHSRDHSHDGTYKNRMPYRSDQGAGYTSRYDVRDPNPMRRQQPRPVKKVHICSPTCASQ